MPILPLRIYMLIFLQLLLNKKDEGVPHRPVELLLRVSQHAVSPPRTRQSAIAGSSAADYHHHDRGTQEITRLPCEPRPYTALHKYY